MAKKTAFSIFQTSPKLALENWDYDADTLDGQLRHFRISSNAVYPFLCQGKAWFLRLSPKQEKLERNLRGELEFLRYLQSKNYPAAVPVASHSGEWVVSLHSPWGAYYASVFQGVDGIPIEDTDCGGRVLFAYGQALGRLHSLSAAYAPRHKKWTCFDVMAWTENVLREHSAPASILAECAAVRQALEALAKTDEPFGLVHYDFEPDNVFWDEKSQSCAAIDFEDGMYHFFLVDLEQALDALLENIPAGRHEAAKALFLRGYQTIKPLARHDPEALKQMRRFCNLYAYARLVRCVAEASPHEPDWMVELREKLRQKISFLESEITG